MANRDMVQLKLQKKLIQERLNKTDHKIDRLGAILDKKAAAKSGFALPPDQSKITSHGVTVSELRIAPRESKAVFVDSQCNLFETKSTPVTNQNIIRIRQQYCLNTEGKAEVKKMQKKAEALQKKRITERQFPSIPIPESLLPNRYLRGELPCTIEHGVSGKYLSWACALENLDYEYYLPLFFDGLQCKDKIITFIACQGIEDMLFASRGHPQRIKSVIPLIIRPIRNALSKFDVDILLWTLKALQQLITCNEG